MSSIKLDFSSEEIRNLYQDCTRDTSLSGSNQKLIIARSCEQISEFVKDTAKIENYCLSRLDEIIKINRFSNSPVAFSTIMSFWDFLAKLSFEERVYDSLTPEESQYRKTSKKCFIDFSQQYVRELQYRVSQGESIMYPRRYGKKSPKMYELDDFNTLGEILYSCVRCGLVHDMNVSGDKADDIRQDQLVVKITHSAPLQDSEWGLKSFGKIINDSDSMGIELHLDAFAVCRALRLAVFRMFSDSKAVESVEKVLMKTPIIMEVE